MTVRKDTLRRFIKSSVVLVKSGEGTSEWGEGVIATLRALDQWFELGYFTPGEKVKG